MQAEVTKTISTLIPVRKDGPTRAELWRVRGGLAFTVAYLLVVCGLVALKWKAFLCLPLNELGDFFAGAFGPLALLWLVLGYFQQGEELQQNTEALRLQAQELAHSVAEQKALVEISRQQFEVEIKHRREDDARQHLNNQPRFKFSAQLAPSSLTGQLWSVEITNHGATCHRVEFSINQGIWSLYDTRGAGIIPTNGSHRISLYRERVKAVESTLTITYFDAVNRKEFQDFVVVYFIRGSNGLIEIRAVSDLLPPDSGSHS